MQNSKWPPPARHETVLAPGHTVLVLPKSDSYVPDHTVRVVSDKVVLKFLVILFVLLECSSHVMGHTVCFT